MEILRPEAITGSPLPDTLEAQNRMPVLDFPDDRHIPYLTYRKTSCYGNCPTFIVKFYADGRLEYHGKANVERLGITVGTFDPNLMHEIIEVAKELDLHSLQNTYPDYTFKNDYLSSTIISIRLRSWQFHTFTWWFDEPYVLRQMERAISNLLLTVQWDE